MDSTVAIREIYWNIPGRSGEIFLYVLAIGVLAFATRGVLRDIARWRRGRPIYRIDRLGARALELLQQVFGQKRVLRDRRAGLMHAMIFFGFLALFIGTDVIAIEEDFTVPFLGPDAGKILVGSFYQSYELILDTLGLIFALGLSWAAWRRYRTRPERLDNRRTDAWVLGSLLFIGWGGFLIEGLRLANQQIAGVAVYSQSWARLSYVGFTLATLFRGVGLGDGSAAGLLLHQALWFSHAAVSFAAIGSLPFGKFKHILYTPLNTFFRKLAPKGALPLIPAMEAEIEKDEPRLGVASLADLSWKHRLDLDACMRCGRCQEVCPAHASGADLSPKWLITKMHDLMHNQPVVFRDGTVETQPESAPPQNEIIPLYGNLFTENELWSCTTCRACEHECPAMIEHVTDIVDLRRNLTMIQSEVPQGVKQVLEGIERAGNPWRLPKRERSAWAAGLNVPTLAEKGQVDVLYWVGCAPSYDDRSRSVARTMVQLFERAGVDFAILGDEETCTGDPARRMGEELLYQAQAQTNIETMAQYQFKRVVTTCAHCFNTIKNEYPQFGGGAGRKYQVIHHTEFLAQLVADGKLTPSEPVHERVAYHDPCYIGRYNDVYDAPRALLQSIPGLDLVEAPEANRERALCCGGGGGNVWMEGWGKQGVNVIRLEQLRKPAPTTLAVACPFCMVMFEDAAKNTGADETLARKDVAELLLASLRASEPPEPSHSDSSP
ncbi:MAG: 4Fe-4S dicluster domain-containing protein [Chloroflexales bacterium]|nr:4Fe-4S dicluster domain-containing protein [Chloroflexales bacterium]